jgi:AcrR family transcriptional regulator
VTSVSTTASEVASASPRSPKGARTRARLIEAAKDVFAEHGLADARIADITARAGVAYGSFYTYFDSKEAVFREVAEEVHGRLRAPVDDVIFARGSGKTPQERLREAIRLHFESYRDDARLLGVIEQAARLDDGNGSPLGLRANDSTEKVADSIRLLQRRGLADQSLDPWIAAAALGSMTSRFAELWLARGQLDCDFDAGVDTVTRLFVNALGLDPID